nr:MAG TPA: hypothetical protein [Caudoviricetes sp.]
MKPGAYIRVRHYEDGTVFVVRTNSAGGIAAKYRGYPRPYGYTLYPIYINKALIEPGIITNKHFVDDRLIVVERSAT